MIFRLYYTYRKKLANLCENSPSFSKFEVDLVTLEKKHDNVIDKENKTKEEEEEFAFVEKLYEDADKLLNIKIGFRVNRWIFNKGWIFNVDLSLISSDKIIFGRDKHSSHSLSLQGFNDKSNMPYWKFKNSWGNEGIDGGFLRFEIGIFDNIWDLAKRLYKNINSDQLSAPEFKYFKLPLQERFSNAMKGLQFHNLFVDYGRDLDGNQYDFPWNDRTEWIDYNNHLDTRKSMFFKSRGTSCSSPSLNFKIIIPERKIFDCADDVFKKKVQETLQNIDIQKKIKKKKLINIYKKYLNSIIRYRIKSFQTNISNSVFKSVVAPRERDIDFPHPSCSYYRKNIFYCTQIYL